MRRLVIPALLLPGLASAAPAPARLGDYSLGAGPAFVVDRGEPGGGVTGEANLLWRSLSLGVHARAAAVDGELRPAAGIELAYLGMVGVGASVQGAGPSFDALLAVPIPIYRWHETYLSFGWRPSWLLEGGGWVHEIALQLKWSSLLVPEDF